MRWSILTIILFLAPLVVAEEFIFDSALYATDQVTVQIDIDNTVRTSGDIKSLETLLLYYPHEFLGQETKKETTSPTPQQQGDALLFRWEDPKGDVSLAYSAKVQSTFHRPQITQKIPFPLESIPAEAQEYLSSEQIIRITPDIRKTAAQIVGDEDDAVRAVFKIGQWVKDNIEYSLTTVTAEAAQTSQWVLDTRTGVCDELTSLFIAMLRSQGVPARFISGVAYTNLEILDTFWGPHGWAEVYYPGIGWVPYDVTYGQFGFVDATHIAFTSAKDATGKAAEYSMLSRGGQLDPQGIERTTTLIHKGDVRQDELPMRVETALQEVGFGSYNRIDVTVENPYNYYRSTELFLAQTTGLTTDDVSRSILLGPNEQKTFHWVVQVDDQLQNGFLYTFPVLVYTNTNTSYETTFVAHSGAQMVTEKELAVIEEDSAVVLENAIDCIYKEQAQENEEILITCTYPTPATLCIEDACTEGTEITQAYTFSELGVQSIIVTGEEGEKKQRTILTIQVLDDPTFTLELEGPDLIKYKHDGSLFILLEKTSTATPENIQIELQHDLFGNSWHLENLASPGRIEVQLPGSHLYAGENTVTAIAKMGDFEIEEEIIILSEGEGFSEHLVLWINKLSSFIARLVPVSPTGNAVYDWSQA